MTKTPTTDPNADEYPRAAENRHVVAHLIQRERDRQNVKYPTFARSAVEMHLVLVEEVGELASALMDLTLGSWPTDRQALGSAIDEAVQVAAVAARIAEHLIERRERER